MNKDKKTNIIGLMVIIIVVTAIAYTTIVNLGMFYKSYDSIDAAIESSWQLKSDVQTETIEDNGFSIVLCSKDSHTRIESLYFTENGWKVISKQIKNSKKYNIDNFIISHIEFKDKNIFLISCADSLIETEFVPTDSINSSFKHLASKQNMLQVKYWMLVLNELPPNYSITINNKTQNIN